MIVYKNITTVFLICFVSYTVSDIFFNGDIFYSVGGLLGSFSKYLELNKMFYLLWLTLLILVTLIYSKAKNKPIKVILIILLWALFYIIDTLLFELMPEITSKLLGFIHTGISVLLKSLMLSTVYYIGNRRN
jgi:hypothetical protein